MPLLHILFAFNILAVAYRVKSVTRMFGSTTSTNGIPLVNYPECRVHIIIYEKTVFFSYNIYSGLIPDSPQSKNVVQIIHMYH